MDDSQATPGPEQLDPAYVDALRRQIAHLRNIISLLVMGEEYDDILMTDLEAEAQALHQDLTNDTIVLPGTGNPEQKHQDILDHAERKYREGGGGAAGVSLNYKEIMAACGCSKRYAYTLMDEMDERYDHCEHRTNPHELAVSAGMYTEVE